MAVEIICPAGKAKARRLMIKPEMTSAVRGHKSQSCQQSNQTE